MKTSAHGIAFIATWESEIDHVYEDVAGVRTIGFGHALRPGESFADGITHEQALDLLSEDVASAEGAVNGYVGVPLTQNQFDALVSFTFNVGAGALEKSTLLQLLNKGDFQGAAAEFPRWCHALKGGVLVADKGLLARRQQEQTLFSSPPQDDGPSEA